MSTPFSEGKDAFLARLTSDDIYDEWIAEGSDELLDGDIMAILKASIPWFKFPRVDITFDDSKEEFLGDLGNAEIQILASYMKCEWYNRAIATWENIRPLYEERDFSQANLLDKLYKGLESEKVSAAKYESNYYRSINYKPFGYRRLAGRGK